MVQCDVPRIKFSIFPLLQGNGYSLIVTFYRQRAETETSKKKNSSARGVTLTKKSPLCLGGIAGCICCW
jgi:hypothetical protein